MAGERPGFGILVSHHLGGHDIHAGILGRHGEDIFLERERRPSDLVYGAKCRCEGRYSGKSRGPDHQGQPSLRGDDRGDSPLREKPEWPGGVAKTVEGGIPGPSRGPWGYLESSLVDGERVIVTLGGAEATLVALDKRTGSTVWKS